MLLVADGDPDLERGLGGQLVEAQRREQAEQHARGALGHRDQCPVLPALVIGQRIQPPCYPDQLAGGHHAGELAPGDPGRDQLPRPGRAGPAQESLDAAFRGGHVSIVP